MSIILNMRWLKNISHICIYNLPSIIFSQVKANVLTVKVEELSLVNSRLEEELKTSQHSQLMEGEKGLETLKLRNKFLQVK